MDLILQIIGMLTAKHKRRIIEIALFLAFVLFIIIIAKYIYKLVSVRLREPYQTSQSYKIPKIIWSYWDNPATVPETVEMCKKSWSKYNPDYTIHFLNKQNYSEYVDIPKEVAEHPRFNDMPQRFADLLRLYLLRKHGGVWCDSSILMGQSLDEWIDEKPGKEVYFFTIEYGNHPERKPIPENWFIAAPNSSPFIQKWLEEFLHLRDFNTAKEYVDDLVKKGVDNRDWCCPDYLAMHHSAQKLIQLDNYPLEKLQMWPSKDGPFRYIMDNNWNPEQAVLAACTNPNLRKPFMKMRINERSELEKGIKDKYSPDKCKWV